MIFVAKPEEGRSVTSRFVVFPVWLQKRNIVEVARHATPGRSAGHLPPSSKWDDH